MHGVVVCCGACQANKVDVIYALSQAWCNSNSDQDFDLLNSYLSSLKPEESILVGEVDRVFRLSPAHVAELASMAMEPSRQHWEAIGFLWLTDPARVYRLFHDKHSWESQLIDNHEVKCRRVWRAGG
jgi:hypothetical protein